MYPRQKQIRIPWQLVCDKVISKLYDHNIQISIHRIDGIDLYVYKKIKNRITPEINAKVEDTLNEWFGVEYEMVEARG